jgi:hypothetical protein
MSIVSFVHLPTTNNDLELKNLPARECVQSVSGKARIKLVLLPTNLCANRCLRVPSGQKPCVPRAACAGSSA